MPTSVVLTRHVSAAISSSSSPSASTTSQPQRSSLHKPSSFSFSSSPSSNFIKKMPLSSPFVIPASLGTPPVATKKVRFSEQQSGARSPVLVTSEDDDDDEEDEDGVESGEGAVKAETPNVEDMDDSALATFLLEALSLHEKGDSSAYINILESIDLSNPKTKDTITTPVLTKWIKSFSSVVSSLNPRLASLVDVLLSLDWLARGKEFGDVYRGFLENLVSAHAFYVRPVVKMLVVGFRSAQVTHKNGAEISNDFDRIHEALRGVLRLIPSGLSFMVPILTEHFPHKSEDLHANVWYMKNMMRVVEYAPVLMKPMWGLAVDRILQIDVEIKTALDDLDDDEHKEVLEHCFDPDAPDLYQKSLYLEGKKEHYSESDSDSDDLNLDDDSDSDSDSEPPPIVHDFAKLTGKLDSMLNVLMGYVKDTLTSPTLRPAQRDAFHNLLAEIFERSVLPTHRCRCTQFLFFYATSLDKAFAETFLVLLAQKTFDTSAPSIIRISASAYLASFVARASFLDVTSVLYCVRMFNNWAVNYVETNELEAEGPDVSRFGVFYAIVQATLYVFCFRWMEIVGAANSGVANGKLPVEMNGFQKVLSSRFAPLLVCSKYVVKEFAKITHRLDILYVYTLMQRSGSDRTQPRTTTTTAVTTTQFLRPPPSAPLSFTPRTLGSPTRNSMMAISPSPSSPMSTSLPNASVGSAAGGGFMQASECLEAFFPFDPCLLRLTGARLEGLYAEWRGDDGDDGDEEDEGRSARSAESDIEFMSTSMDA